MSDTPRLARVRQSLATVGLDRRTQLRALVLFLFLITVGKMGAKSRHRSSRAEVSPDVARAPTRVEPTQPPDALRRAVSLVGAALPALVALGLWASALGDIQLHRMNDLGLVSVLSVRSMVAMGILTLSFCVLVSRRAFDTPLMVLHLGVLILMLYGATVFLEEVPRFAVSWRHAGIADHILQHGAVNPRIDAYFNWPGFFILAALITELADFPNPLSLAKWAPIYLNLLFLLPVVLVLKAVTSDARLVWFGTWIFFLSNWVGQDYFSPQAFSYFLYLVILALLLTWFSAGRHGTEPVVHVSGSLAAAREVETAKKDSEAARRVALLAIIVLLFAVMVSSHQLTPFAALGSVAALIVFRRSTPRGLPLLMAVMLAGWISFMTVVYLTGHFSELTSGIGDLSKNAASSVGGRLRGTPDHLIVLRIRLFMTAGLWALAVLGFLRRRRHGQRDLTFVLLAVAPLPLVALQSYGGEIVLRVYLFALPFVAMLAAGLFFPSVSSGRLWATSALTGVVSLALLGGFLFARYGNERMDQFSRREVSAIDHLYRVAPKGVTILAGSENTPWRSQAYADYRYRTLTRVEARLGQALPRLEDVVSTTDQPGSACGYMVITRSQKAHVELLGVWPPGALSRLETELTSSPHFEVVYTNRDATVFRSTGSGQTASAGADAHHPVGCRR